METLVKKFKKHGTADLLKKVEKLTGDEKLACIKVLKEREQDVSKWETPEVGAPAEKVVFESEEPLTEEEKEILEKASSKDETKSEQPSEITSLRVKTSLHFTHFKKETEGFNKIMAIIGSSNISKLGDTELKMILAVPMDVKKTGNKKPETTKKDSSTKVEIPEEGQIADGVKVSVVKSDESIVEGTIVSYNKNPKGVAFYKIKSDGKVFCRVPKFVTSLEVKTAEAATEEQKSEETGA